MNSSDLFWHERSLVRRAVASGAVSLPPPAVPLPPPPRRGVTASDLRRCVPLKHRRVVWQSEPDAPLRVTWAWLGAQVGVKAAAAQQVAAGKRPYSPRLKALQSLLLRFGWPRRRARKPRLAALKEAA